MALLTIDYHGGRAPDQAWRIMLAWSQNLKHARDKHEIIHGET